MPDNIIGQNKIKKIFRNAIISKEIAHAYLLCGAIGTGKFTLAKRFAKEILCVSGMSGCGNCKSCLLFEAGTHPDFLSVRKTDAEKIIKVDRIRRIREEVFIKPTYTDRRVLLIQDADTMNIEAQNCLLKTLEEPPPYLHIILTASNPNALTDTVRSRMVRLDTDIYSKSEVACIIGKNTGVTIDPGSDELNFIYTASAASPGEALRLYADTEYRQIRDEIFQQLKNAESDRIWIYTFQRFAENNKDKINIILDIMQSFFRDVLVINTCNPKKGGNDLLINADKKSIINKSNLLCDPASIIRTIEIIENTKNALTGKANFSLAIQAMLLMIQEETHK